MIPTYAQSIQDSATLARVDLQQCRLEAKGHRADPSKRRSKEWCVIGRRTALDGRIVVAATNVRDRAVCSS